MANFVVVNRNLHKTAKFQNFLVGRGLYAGPIFAYACPHNVFTVLKHAPAAKKKPCPLTIDVSKKANKIY